jgi:hypothetical protein
MVLKKFLAFSSTAMLLTLTLSFSALAGTPTGAVKAALTQDQIKSDLGLLFTEANAAGYYKPVFSGIIDYKTSINYVAVLPNCKDDSSHPCVKSFDASTDNGINWISASSSKTYVAKTFDQSKYPAGSYIVQTKNWLGDEKTLLPSGTDTSVYTFPKASHFGGSEYLLQPIVEGVSSNQIANAKANKLSLSIIPIRTYEAPNPNNCSLWISTCFDLYHFDSSVSFRVVLDLKYLAPTFSGWFQSRIKNSEIAQLTSTEFSFTGSAMAVSSVLAEFNKPYPDSLLLAYPNLKTGAATTQFPIKLMQVWSNTNSGIKEWINHESAIPKQANWESTIWTATSYSTAASGYIYTQMNGCLQSSKGMLGQVSTNATVYTISAPLWDDSTDSLSFTIAAPSFESDGEKKQGLYDLVLREDIAKCLWGKDLTNTSAKIEILNVDGTSQVATTSFKKINGYIYFRSAGFHYSVPKIRVSLVQSLPSPTASPIAESSSNKTTLEKRVTITCTSGKKIKKITGTKPVCPSGYKKKEIN